MAAQRTDGKGRERSEGSQMKRAPYHLPGSAVALGNKTAFGKDKDISCSMSLIDSGATSLYVTEVHLLLFL